jgi:hypothetical protein
MLDWCLDYCGKTVGFLHRLDIIGEEVVIGAAAKLFVVHG